MQKTSTPKAARKASTQKSPSPSARTIDFLRQFARAYSAPATAVAMLPGVVLN